MNTNAASLDRLHDILVPAPVPWWPPAPGWGWVMAFVLVLLAAGLQAFVRWQHNRYRREALAELTRLESALHSAEQRAAALLHLAELLKRTALTVFPREQVAGLTGARWFEFLDRTGPGSGFGGGNGVLLENAIYDPRTAATLDDTKLRELTALVRHWLVHHRVEAATGGPV